MVGLLKRIFTVIPLTLFGIAIGCHAAPDTSGRHATSATARQLIIKFKAGTIACNAAGIAAFSATSAVRLEFIRPMSGDACVVKQLADEVGGFMRDQATLQRQSSIEWIEEDAPMKAL
ncbi:MAG: hypothetical protein JWQ23_1662 [Herminiimonas sp.]|nr:hypothetical protein [Herminiimonas sp.]